MTKNDRAVMALSVYNAVSLGGRDMTVDEVVAFLARHWDPTSSRNAERLSAVTVEEAAMQLERLGFARLDGRTIRIDARDPRTRRGVTLNVDYTTGQLVPPRSF